MTATQTSAKPASPAFTIVTPVFNGATYLAETIRSVLGQSTGDFEYIILDGGSTDGSRAIIEEFAKTDARIIVVFAPDEGMYDAILRGFAMGSGRVCCWINADDKLMPWALETVGEAFTVPGVQWVTGIPAIWDPMGRLALVGRARSYPRSVIARGLCHGRGWGFIQQESTFFARELLEGTTPEIATRIRAQRLAGDFLLWVEFSRRAELHTLPTVLAGFRVHSKNQSAGIDEYYAEVRAAGYPVPPRAFQLFFKPAALIVDNAMGLRRRAAIRLRRQGWRDSEKQ